MNIFANSVNPELERQINKLLSNLTLEEKVERLTLKGWSNELKAKGIPRLPLTDGPFGIRTGTAVYTTAPQGFKVAGATAFPVGTNMAATWNSPLLREVGYALGKEASASGIAGMWGPAVNILRSPLNGRNFEYFGEDPYLAGCLAVAYIHGMQEAGTIACIKHFACNSLEEPRHYTDAQVSERALREIYFPAFEMAVKEVGVWSVMNAYNRVNGVYCAENFRLQETILREEWGFRGYVISDWEAVASTVETYNSGCDIEMPDMFLTPEKVLPLLESGELKEAVLNEKIRRVLRCVYSMNMVDTPVNVLPLEERHSLLASNNTIAEKAAIESIVLLKNEKVLPIPIERLPKWGFIGLSAIDLNYHGGEGSSSRVTVAPPCPLQDLENDLKGLGVDDKLQYEPGVRLLPDNSLKSLPSENLQAPIGQKGVLVEYFAGENCSGSPVASRVEENFSIWRAGTPPVDGISENQTYSIRWSGSFRPKVLGRWLLVARLCAFADSEMRIWIDNKLVIEGSLKRDQNYNRASAKFDFHEDRAYLIRVEYSKGSVSLTSLFELEGIPDPCPDDNRTEKQLLDDAVTLARESEGVVLFASLSRLHEKEGTDRLDLRLTANQENLIMAVTSVNPRVIVILNVGAPVVMSKWLGRVQAVIVAGLPGQGGGRAIANILTGLSNPSGKLPYSIAKSREDWPDYGNFSWEPNATVHYKEDIFVGYRHFDSKGIEVDFPFGHGLSYTNFSYRNLKLTALENSPSVQVRFEIVNTGSRPGAEAAQVYVGNPTPCVPRPPNELKAFSKVYLEAGETRELHLTLNERAFAFFDESTSKWKIEAGLFRISVGSSSRELHLQSDYSISRSFFYNK